MKISQDNRELLHGHVTSLQSFWSQREAYIITYSRGMKRSPRQLRHRLLFVFGIPSSIWTSWNNTMRRPLRTHREQTILNEVVCDGYSKVKVKMVIQSKSSPQKRIPSIHEVCNEIVMEQRRRLEPTILHQPIIRGHTACFTSKR